MVDINWGLAKAEVAKSAEINGTNLTNVVTKVFLSVSGTAIIDGAEVSHQLPDLEVILGDPSVDNFVSIDALTEEQAFTWAMDSISQARKDAVESFITNKIELEIGNTYTIFE